MKFTFPIKQTRALITVLGAFSIVSCTSTQQTSTQQSTDLTASQKLGKELFFDARLSSPAGQSCASCHSPKHGFSHPIQNLATAEGATKGLFGNRNVPSIAYIGFTPKFHKEIEDGDTLYVGGFFLDGRESTLAEQATKPLLNPIEMGIADEATLVRKIKDSGYEEAFNTLYGDDSLNDTKTAIQFISRVIANYQGSHELSPFNSKYDAYLAGKAQLTKQELQGLKLFEAEDKGNCAACHPSKLDKASGFPPLFTDYTYDNLGVAFNPENPFLKNSEKYNALGMQYRDKGLGESTNDKNQDGKFKVPTLRNIALTAPYMHNGVLKTLEDVVSFYNTRDTDSKWGDAEVAENVNTDELGDLKLSDNEVDDIVAFLKTLTDGYQTHSKVTNP